MSKEEPVLYGDGVITIEENPREPEGHILTIGKVATALGRRVLEDMARSPLRTCKQMTGAVNPLILDALKEANLPYEKLAYAIVRARLKEVNDFNDYLISQRTAGK